jgi:vacuolar-type H+-ATPase subunit I/STV1
MPTTSLGFAFAFFVAAFIAALVGLALREYLAERLRLEHARDMVGGVTGLVMTLVALVFGLLIWTAFGSFPRRRPSCR